MLKRYVHGSMRHSCFAHAELCRFSELNLLYHFKHGIEVSLHSTQHPLQMSAHIHLRVGT